MFGDWNWVEYRSGDQHRRLSEWLQQIQKDRYRLAIVELGAGTAVPTVRYTSESVADRFNGTLIRINPRDYQVPDGHISIPLGAKEGVEKIDRLIVD